MKTLSGGMTSALALESTYLCRIWQLTLQNGTILYYTDHDEDVVYSSQTYVSDPGIEISAVTQTDEGTQDATIKVNFLASLIDEDMVRRGSLDEASFNLWIVDYKTIANGVIPLFSGKVGDIEFHDRYQCTVNVRSLLKASGGYSGDIYQKTCRAKWGDSRCGIDKEDYAVSFTVDTVASDQQSFTSSELASLGNADNYFSIGAVLWLTGENADLWDDVRTSVDATGTIGFALVPRFAVAIGDTGKIYPGCNKEVLTCDTKFDNLLNFRGEPFAPPTDLNRFGQFGSTNSLADLSGA